MICRGNLFRWVEAAQGWTCHLVPWLCMNGPSPWLRLEMPQ